MTNLQLRAFIKRHHLTKADIAVKGMVSMATVRAWLRPKTSKAHRNMTRQSAALIRSSIKPARKLRATKKSASPGALSSSQGAGGA